MRRALATPSTAEGAGLARVEQPLNRGTLFRAEAPATGPLAGRGAPAVRLQLVALADVARDDVQLASQCAQARP